MEHKRFEISPVLCEGAVDSDNDTNCSDIEYEEYEGSAAPIPNPYPRPDHTRHNNTPHGHEDMDRPSHSPIGQSMSERVRVLLDRFAINEPSNAPPPATQPLIDHLPEMQIDHLPADLDCAICKIQVELGQSVKVLPCGHSFHSRCIVTWLHIHASCPLCRRRLPLSTPSVIPDGPDQHENRLRDLRRRRRMSRTLRVRTPQSRGPNESNEHREIAATELIHAVCQILDRYQNGSGGQQRNERMVRFRDCRDPKSPRPPPPRSSRSNTQTVHSLAHSVDAAMCPIDSSPSPKHAAHWSLAMDSNHSMDHDDGNEMEHRIDPEDEAEPISASRIRQDFAKWMLRRSRSTDDVEHRMTDGHSVTSPQRKDHKLPPMTVPFGTEWSGQTVIERPSGCPVSPRSLISGQCSPNGYDAEEEEQKGTVSAECDRFECLESVSPFNLSRPVSVSNTPTPRSRGNLHAVFSLMTDDELETARNRHQQKMDQQQYVVRQIAAEQQRRALLPVGTMWKCPECRLQPRAFVVLPCRHLGLCVQCDRASKMGKCRVCNVRVQQKIAINFTE